MLKLEEIKKDSAVSGIDAAHPVRIVTTEAVGDSALTVYYKTPDGRLLERMLFRTDEPSLSLAEAGQQITPRRCCDHNHCIPRRVPSSKAWMLHRQLTSLL